MPSSDDAAAPSLALPEPREPREPVVTLARGDDLDRVDPTGARIGAVTNVEGRAGAIVTDVQLAMLAPLLAEHVGLQLRAGEGGAVAS